MKALYNLRHGGLDVLQVRESPDPTPGPGEVRIRVSRAGLNFADISARVGLYPDAPKPPMVMGYEVAGTVDQLGDGVTGLAVGTRVLGFTPFKGQASHVVVKANQAIPLPEKMTLDHAAALPVNYLTAFHMMHYVGNLQPGDSVLIHMAAGGVGMAAIQLARRIPDVTIFGTASAKKHATLREAGVQHPIDYRSVDYAAEVMRITNGRGVRMVLDPLGGADWEKGYGLLQPTGHLICFGFSNAVTGTKRNLLKVIPQLLRVKKYSPMALMDKNRSVSGVNLGHLWSEEALLAREMKELFRLYEEGVIRPNVDKVFPLEKAAEAHQYVQDGKNVGKVLFDCT